MKQKNLILMGVAVGCGLVAAVLTARMNAGPAPIEKVEVVVPAKDIPVGTMLTKEDVAKLFTRKQMAKDAVPAGIVEVEDELIDKRVARNYSVGEPIKREDLKKGAVVSIPPGYQMIAQPFSVPAAVAGFVTPGSRVDILGTVRLGNKIAAFPILINMLILAVDNNVQLPKDQGTFASLGTVSFAVDQKQALVLELAKVRGCTMTLLLRNPNEPVIEQDQKYNIDEVIKRLQDDKNPADVVPSEDVAPKKTEEPKDDVPAPPPPPETDKVLVAVADIAPGTDLTVDVATEKFEVRELPKGLAAGHLDPKLFVGKTLKTGLGKGQWLTGSVLGDPGVKPTPRDGVDAPKPGDPNPPVNPVVPVAPAKKKTHDLAIHTTSGTKWFRYEEVKPGQWRLVGEVQPGGRGTDDDAATPNQKID